MGRASNNDHAERLYILKSGPHLGSAAKQAAMVRACVAKRNDWVKYEADGSRPRSTPEVVAKDSHVHKLNKEDAMDCRRWRKLIKDV